MSTVREKVQVVAFYTKEALLGRLSMSPARVIASRRHMCNECPARDDTRDVCTACGCWLPAKIRIQQSECPMEMWPPV